MIYLISKIKINRGIRLYILTNLLIALLFVFIKKLGALFGGHVRLVFTLVLFIYIACVFVTLTSFPEMPLSTLENETSGTQVAQDFLYP